MTEMLSPDPGSGDRMRARHGFTIIELLVVMILAAVVAGTAIPRLTGAMAQNRLQRATSVLSADLRLAHSMAARRAAPVRIDVDTAGRSLRVRNFSGTDTVFSTRHLGTNTEFGIQRMTSNQSIIIVYPNGISITSVLITLRAAGTTRRVTMSRAGQVRILP
jgi:type II secretion system protein H